MLKFERFGCLVFLIAACTQRSSESSGSQQAAIHGGTVDSEEPNSNVVAQLTNSGRNLRGTGFLITPALLLTANHTLTGKVGDPNTGLGPAPRDGHHWSGLIDQHP